MPDVRYHDLRHSCATLLLTKGVHPKLVSEMLGHSSVAITLDTYSDVIPELGEAAARAMEDMLGSNFDGVMFSVAKVFGTTPTGIEPATFGATYVRYYLLGVAPRC